MVAPRRARDRSRWGCLECEVWCGEVSRLLFAPSPRSERCRGPDALSIGPCRALGTLGPLRRQRVEACTGLGVAGHSQGEPWLAVSSVGFWPPVWRLDNCGRGKAPEGWWW